MPLYSTHEFLLKSFVITRTNAFYVFLHLQSDDLPRVYDLYLNTICDIIYNMRPALNCKYLILAVAPVINIHPDLLLRQHDIVFSYFKHALLKMDWFLFQQTCSGAMSASDSRLLAMPHQLIEVAYMKPWMCICIIIVNDCLHLDQSFYNWEKPYEVAVFLIGARLCAAVE